MRPPAPHPLLADPRPDGSILRICFVAALTVHLVILVLPWKKQPYIPDPPPVKPSLTITPYDIQPPEIPDRPVREIRTGERRVFLLADDPDDELLAPLDDLADVELPEAVEGDWDLIIEEDAGPPRTGPFDSWEDGLELPRRLPGSDKPEYPPLAVAAGLEGKVILRAVIDEEGRVVEVEVLREPRSPVGFTEAAIEAVSNWRYRPGRLNGRSVPVRMTVTVEFSLQ